MKKTGLIVVGVIALALVLLVVKEQSKVGKSKVESQGNGTTKFTQTTKEIESAGGGTSVTRQQVEPVAKKPEWKTEELSEAVQQLLGLDGKEHNYPELLKAVAALHKDLSTADVAALREMLTFPNDRFPKMRPIEVNAVKNDVLDRLLKQTELSEGLGLQMAEMAADSSNDPVWRDYCIQFMEPFYERKSKVESLKVEGQGTESLATEGTKGSQKSQKTDDRGQGTDDGGQRTEDSHTPTHAHTSIPTHSQTSSPELVAIQSALLSALDQRSETLAGTALIGLELLSRTHDEFDREAILKKSVEIAADESASASCRLTALRLTTSLTTEDTETIHAARSLAQTGETVLLRSAAIATLGEIGSADDRELLDTFALSDNKQIAAAAKMAIQKMDARKK